MAANNGSISLNTGSITNQHFSSAAADILQAAKVQHIYHGDTNFALPVGGTPISAEYIVWVANVVGTILDFQALLAAVGSVSNMSFDLLKNGVSVLSALAVITNANTNRQVVAGTLSSNSFVIGDVFSIKLVMTTNTGAQGPYAFARFQENTAG